VPLTGAVIVTTPQEVALADALKGLKMFKKFEVLILGIVENMGLYIDPKTGQNIAFFGEGGGQRMSERLQVPYLGSVPLDPQVREGGDASQPIVSHKPDSLASQALNQIAQKVAARISVVAPTQADRSLAVTVGNWPSRLASLHLRAGRRVVPQQFQRRNSLPLNTRLIAGRFLFVCPRHLIDLYFSCCLHLPSEITHAPHSIDQA